MDPKAILQPIGIQINPNKISKDRASLNFNNMSRSPSALIKHLATINLTILKTIKIYLEKGSR